MFRIKGPCFPDGDDSIWTSAVKTELLNSEYSTNEQCNHEITQYFHAPSDLLANSMKSQWHKALKDGQIFSFESLKNFF
jgi:hypothetical protein